MLSIISSAGRIDSPVDNTNSETLITKIREYASPPCNDKDSNRASLTKTGFTTSLVTKNLLCKVCFWLWISTWEEWWFICVLIERFHARVWIKHTREFEINLALSNNFLLLLFTLFLILLIRPVDCDCDSTDWLPFTTIMFCIFFFKIIKSFLW